MAAAGLYKGYTYLVLETDEIDAIDADINGDGTLLLTVYYRVLDV